MTSYCLPKGFNVFLETESQKRRMPFSSGNSLTLTATHNRDDICECEGENSEKCAEKYLVATISSHI